jgi:hypothetical protein
MRGCLRANALLLVLLAAAAAAAGTIDDSMGFITPGSGPPAFNPSLWNRAYSVSALNVPKAEATPFPLGTISDLSECTRVNGSAPPNLQAAAMVREGWWQGVLVLCGVLRSCAARISIAARGCIAARHSSAAAVLTAAAS